MFLEIGRNVMRLVAVSLDSGMVFIFAALALSSMTETMSTAAGSINSSAVVWVFLHYAIWYATLNDAKSAHWFTDVALKKRADCWPYCARFC